jgi:hypothetical protein
MDREEFDAMTAEDVHAHAEHERDELRQSLWLQLAREIAVSQGGKAGDLPAERADHLYHATGAVYADISQARPDGSDEQSA